MGRGKDDQLLELLAELARECVVTADSLHLVAEQLDPDPQLLVGRVQLDRVAPRPEAAPGEDVVISRVVQLDEPAQKLTLVDHVPGSDDEDPVLVLLGRTEAVDARHRGHDDHVTPEKQARGGRVTEAVDLVVDRRVLLDIGIGRRQVRLGLVVVVVRDEVLHPVLREKLLQLRRELSGERLVRLDHEGRALDRFDRPCDGGGLSAAGYPEKRLIPLPRSHALRQGADRSRLVASRLERRDHLERRHWNQGSDAVYQSLRPRV